MKQQRKLISLVGMTGCGKTSVGKVLASRIGADFIDVDDEIVKRHGSIRAIFDERGDEGFREVEYETLQSIIDGVSSGGNESSDGNESSVGNESSDGTKSSDRVIIISCEGGCLPMRNRQGLSPSGRWWFGCEGVPIRYPTTARFCSGLRSTAAARTTKSCSTRAVRYTAACPTTAFTTASRSAPRARSRSGSVLPASLTRKTSGSRVKLTKAIQEPRYAKKCRIITLCGFKLTQSSNTII